VVRLMGVKERARKFMRDAGVPVLPSSKGVLSSAAQAMRTAAEIGYPVILKASAAGGRRGMRIVHEQREIAGQFAPAKQEAGAAFGCPDVYLEKYIGAPRYIEISGPGRPVRQRGGPRGTRLQHPTPASEASRRIAFPGVGGQSP